MKMSSPTFCSRNGSTPVVAAVTTIAATVAARIRQFGRIDSRSSRAMIGQAGSALAARASETMPSGVAALFGSALAIARFGFQEPVQMDNEVAHLRVVDAH